VVGTIETERLTLRPIAEGDAELLVALDADPTVMQFISGGAPTSLADAESIVKRSLGHRWLGFDRATGAFVGWYGIRLSDDRGRERELGYRLRRANWGKGLATEGSVALIAAAFTDLGTERIWAQTMAVNTRSRRVMERCGLRYVRTFHLEWDDPIEGTEHGEVEYELTESEWENARAGFS
jgi:RimJ/RimL family protein N-acetyltransferase